MILPIYIYPESVLRKPADDVEEDSDDIRELVGNMIETMHGASGIGLAAPQVGRSERVFVVDLTPLAEDLEEGGEVVPREPLVFINPEIIEESVDVCEYEEGCLSIPELREVVERPERIRVRYKDRNFEDREEDVRGLLARVLQHEYDHLEGILFVDLISPFRRRMLRRRLREMARGEFEADYPVVQNRK